MLLVTWLENWITVTVCNCALFLSPIGPHIWFCVSTILFLLGWLYSVVWDQASECFQHCPISLGLLGLVCFLFVCLFCASIRLQFFFSISMKNMVGILMRIVLNVNAAFKNTLPAIVVLRIALLFLHLLVAFIPGNFWKILKLRYIPPCHQLMPWILLFIAAYLVLDFLDIKLHR